MDAEAVPLAVAVQTYIEDQVPLHRHWRRFTPKQRELTDALDQELVRLIQKVGTDDYFGALGIAPSSNLASIRSAADRIRTQFSEARVRTYGLNRKTGGWATKARQIDALARHTIDTLEQMKREDKLDAHAAKCRSALIAAMTRPAAAPCVIEHHQGERPNR